MEAGGSRLFDSKEGLSDMQRTRTKGLLFWPTLTAAAIVALLLAVPQLRQWLGLPETELEQHARQAIPTVAAKFRLPPPPTLHASGHAGLDTTSGPRVASIDRLDQDRLHDSIDDLICDVSPQSADDASEPDELVQGGAILLAPVRDTREELAGFAPLNSQAIQTTAAQMSGVNAALASSRTTSGTRLDARGDLHSDQAATIQRADTRLEDRRAIPSLSPGSDRESVFDGAGNEPPELDASPNRARLGIAWPRTPSLDTTLGKLSASMPMRPWCEAIQAELRALQALSSLQDDSAGTHIATLRQLAELGLEYGESRTDDRSLQIEILRTSHAIHRRSLIWRAVWAVQEVPFTNLVADRDVRGVALEPLLDALQKRIEQTGDASGWQSYLMLEEVATQTDAADADARRLVAQRLLSRLRWDGLSEPQRAWLDDGLVRELEMHVRPWAETPVNYVHLLRQLERLESDALDLGGIDVAGAVQSLRFSNQPRAVHVAKVINNYYRNANLRVAVAASLLEDLLPEIPHRTTPIRQTIAGVPVRGTGVVQSQLRLRLDPAPDAWQFFLSTDGQIHGRTSSQQWPVRITNQSVSDFQAATPIRIHRHGMQLEATTADVQSHVELRGLQTEFDGFPVIDSLVRSIAMRKYRERAPLARQQSESLTRRQLQTQVHEEIDQEVRKASDKLATHLLGPLGQLELSPLVVDLETTDTRLAARYRVAGDWQMGAFTPRPRALSRSVMSMQLHQSLLNNMFEQLAPSGEAKRLVDIHRDLMSLFGVETSVPPKGLPDDVSIRFSRTRPITVEIDDDRLWLTLRVVQLKDEGSLDLSHFVVRAAYRPVIDGLQTRLEREGVVQIDGPRLGFREKLPIRAIFTRVLGDDRPLPLVAKSLADHANAQHLTVELVELTDGWLSLSICPRT